MFIHITLAGSKFSSRTLPTMHSIYLYTDIYQGLNVFANSCTYIYVVYVFNVRRDRAGRVQYDIDPIHKGVSLFLLYTN